MEKRLTQHMEPTADRQTHPSNPTNTADFDHDITLGALEGGNVISIQRIPWSSNYTFLAELDMGGNPPILAIYKPCDGERPLYDFPDKSLYKREYAAYLLSKFIRWPNIPPTVIRDGPYGIGAMQLFIETDYQITYFDLIGNHEDQLRKFAVFDLLTNNADRKGGHCLLDGNNNIWSIDHGLTFHHEFKLRTVMVEFWGTEIPNNLITDLRRLSTQFKIKGQIHADLSSLLQESEIIMLEKRLEEILRKRIIPSLSTSHNVPWPLE